MNSKTWMRIMTLTLFATLTISVKLAAQDKAEPHHLHQYHHYQINDVGTFGGPSSYLNLPPFPRAGVLNNRGTVVGFADTATPDPLCFFSPDCYYTDGYQWQNGVKSDLGVLPGWTTGQGNWVSANGLIAGVANNGQTDPLAGIPVLHGVLYENGGVTDLGTLEGGYFSFTSAVNNRGEVVGFAQNTIPDPNSMLPGYPYQSRAFYWKNGVMQDLGTLGTGTDAIAALINERGQVVGWSYTNSVPSAVCAGFNYGFSLTTSSFIWEQRNGMRDIGGLGGTCTLATDFNNRGQIVGGSSVTGDLLFHPFVWDAETGVTDLLRSSDVNYGLAKGENNRREVVGGACDTTTCYALLWRKTGAKWEKTTLGTIAGFGFAGSINNSGQVVGMGGNGPFLWEDGGPMADLNTLIPPNSGIQLSEPGQINDRGEIAAQGPDTNGNNHAVLLVPCDENHPDVEGCDYSMVDAAAATQSPAPRYVPSGAQPLPQSGRGIRYRMFGRGAEAGGGAAPALPVSPESDATKPSFFFVSLSPLAPSSVSPGGSSTSAVTAGLTGGGAGTAALTCSVQPSPPLAPTCSITPASLSFPGATATLTVSTVGPRAALLSHGDHGLLYALWLPLIGLVGMGAGLGSNPIGCKGKLKKVALGCALFAGLTFLLACGGGNVQRTPPGTYTIGVTATAFIPVNTAFDSKSLTVQ